MGLEACALGADVLLTDVEVYTGMLRSEPGSWFYCDNLYHYLSLSIIAC